MKNLILVLSLFLGLNLAGQNQTRKVLFIGNSYTEANHLPQIIADAAASVGDILIFDSNTPGGYRLLQHSTNADTQNKIMTGVWDYVVLQGQSHEPILQESDFAEGARNLKNIIKQYNPCATPILYMTWGRKNGDPLNCANIPVLCTYEVMDTALKNAYLDVATILRTEVSPVSVVWKYLRQNNPAIELYDTDGSHPSAAGSYAAACSFYATIFKKDPTLITFNYNLNPTDAAIIRNAAKINVYDNLSAWDYKQLPVSNFTYTIGAGTNEVVFANTMQNADNYLWDFGDGTTSSTTLNPTHTYANNGTYTVTLTTTNCDLQGQHQSTYSNVVRFCPHTPSISPEILKLCYDSSGTLWTEPADSYQWYDDGIPIPGATGQSLTVSLSSMGVFNVNSPSVMSTINGCSELSKPSQIKTHQWSEFGPVMFGLNVNGNVINGNQVCNDETLSLDIYFQAEYHAQWYKDDVAIPFATSNTLIVTESGTYKVRIDHPSCPNYGFFSIDPLSFEFIDCSLGTIEFPDDLIISPNPAQNILKIQTQATIKEIAVYDMLGKKITPNQISTNALDVSRMAQGTYIIKIIGENDKTFSTRFIKQ